MTATVETNPLVAGTAPFQYHSGNSSELGRGTTLDLVEFGNLYAGHGRGKGETAIWPV